MAQATDRFLSTSAQVFGSGWFGSGGGGAGESKALSALNVLPAGSMRPSGHLKLRDCCWNFLMALVVLVQARPSTLSAGDGPPLIDGTLLSRAWTILTSSDRFVPSTPTDARIFFSIVASTFKASRW